MMLDQLFLICFHIIILRKDPYYIAKFVFEIKALFIDEFDKMSIQWTSNEMTRLS